ncbi:MAG: hypothetical protein ABI199_10740 [Bacteroidia bacterium]
MKHKKIILTSFIITSLYFSTSCIWSFYGFMDATNENLFRQIFEMIYTLPAIIIFGVGYTVLVMDGSI